MNFTQWLTMTSRQRFVFAFQLPQAQTQNKTKASLLHHTKIDKRLVALANRGSKASAATKRKSMTASYMKFRNSIKPLSHYGSSGHYIEETIILEIGSRYTKVGFVGEPSPRRICRTKLHLGDRRLSKKYHGQDGSNPAHNIDDPPGGFS